MFNIPKRLNIGIMLFIITFVTYTMRVNMSINLVAMVEKTDSKNNSSATLPNYGTRYSWSQRDQAWLLGAYFYGYMITSLPGGTIAENFGGKPVAGYSTLIGAILTALTPLAASISKWLVVINRFVIGLLGGVIWPSCHNLISKWSPPDEKSKFVASLMGGTFGTVITWPVSGIVIEDMGWDWAFYIVAIFVILISILWFIIIDESPALHSTITPEEREYIENSLGMKISTKKRVPPYKSMALSMSFWSLFWLHYGNIWGLYFLITATPKFLSEVLGFKLGKTGFLSSLPHLARFFSAFGFGAIADIIRRKECLSVTGIRKVFCIPSHILPGLFLILLAFIGEDPYVCVAIMTISLGFNGAATATNLQNSQDLAPNFAGTLYGIINCWGTTAGFLSPLVVAGFTKENNTLEQWRYIFLVGAAAYILPSILFWIFGSGEVQPWNEVVEKEEEAAKSKA